MDRGTGGELASQVSTEIPTASGVECHSSPGAKHRRLSTPELNARSRLHRPHRFRGGCHADRLLRGLLDHFSARGFPNPNLVVKKLGTWPKRSLRNASDHDSVYSGFCSGRAFLIVLPILILAESGIDARVRNFLESSCHQQPLPAQVKELLQYLFEQASLGIAVEDLEGRSCLPAGAFFNPGIRGERTVRHEFSQFAIPEDSQDDWALFQQLRAGAIDNCSLENRYVRKDGTRVWGRLNVSPLENRDVGSPPSLCLCGGRHRTKADGRCVAG
jgi:PAS domain S-box-containing protein